MKIIAFSNCALDPLLGSGRTRLAWSSGLRALGHAVETVEPGELLAGVKENAPGRRLRMGWNASRWLRNHDLSDVDLIEFYGAEFWPATWRLASRRGRGRRPLLVAHSDGVELLATERMAAAAGPRHARARNPARAAVAAVLRRAETLAFSRCDAIVTGCEPDRRFLIERGISEPARVTVVPLGLEPEFLDLPLSAVREERVAFLGSWIERKGTAHVVGAMVPLLESRPGLHLDLFGVGTDPAEVRRSFPPALHGRIQIVPRMTIPEVIAGLSHARVYLFPSEYEGFGLGLAEAMACGCAAVTTPTGFGAELADGVEAMIRGFGDVAGMRHAVDRLLDNEALRLEIAAAGWKRVQSLRWATSISKLEQTYKKMTNDEWKENDE